MQTLHTVLKRGALFWDRELLPGDVFHGRLGLVQQAIRDANDDAWLIYGDALQYGSLAYVTHFLPARARPWRWSRPRAPRRCWRASARATCRRPRR